MGHKTRVSLARERGAIAVIVAIMMTVLICFAAVAVDASKMWEMRNELQTAADAAALAGGVQLKKDRTLATDSVQAYAQRNYVLGKQVTFNTADVIYGVWNDDAHTFTPVANFDEADAVRVTTREPASYILANIFGKAPGEITATATAWARAPVAESEDCIKPWAIPYQYLTRALDPANPDVYRSLTPDDLARLHSMVENGENQTALTFTFHKGTGSPVDNAGNFYDVVLPRVCVAETQTCDDSEVQNGVDAYTENIYDEAYPGGCRPNPIAVGDVLLTQPGQAAQPTIKATEDFCEAQGVPACNGVPIKAAFWVPLTTSTIAWATEAGLNSADHVTSGRFPVQIKIVGSFMMTSMVKSQAAETRNKAQITGYFTALEDRGKVGNVGSTLDKVILVQ